MANAAAAATQWNLPNFVGEIVVVNPLTTFLNDIGGLNWATANAFKFPCGNLITLEAASQPAITEAASLTAPSGLTYVADQEFNVCQIFQSQVSMSYARLSDKGLLSGITVAGVPVNQDPLAVQLNAHLRQMAKNIDYSFLNGAYQVATAADVAYKTRGVLSAISTSTTAASAGTLTKAMIEATLKKMAAAGADFQDMGLYCNAHNLTVIQAIYGYAPMDRQVGGVAIDRIVTPFCEMAVRFDPQVPAATVGILDRAKCRPVALPVPDTASGSKGVLFYEQLSKTGAGESGELYGQIGLDYGSERFHGSVTGTATS
jgi:hypothetical protein